MRVERQLMFWVGALIVTVVMLYMFRSILLPFVAGMAVAYLLDPVADRLEEWGLNRMLATLTLLAGFILIVVFLSVLLLPVIGQQIVGLISALPHYATRLHALLTENADEWLGQSLGLKTTDLKDYLGGIVGQGAGWLGGLLQSLWSGGQALISLFALLVVTPVVAFYILVDWDRMVERIDSWLPRDSVETIRKLASEIDVTLASFVRGQVSICILLAGFYAAGLSLVGLEFGLLIGLAAGLVSFIPYVGSIFGFCASIGVALVQFWPDWAMIGATLAVFVVGQFLEGNILQPKLLGSSIGLHPVWLMFALFAFGVMMGFVGLLIAVPAAAAIGVMARFALRRYLASPLYHGASGPGGDD